MAYKAYLANKSKHTLRGVTTSLQPVIDKAVKTFAGDNAPPTVWDRARLLAADAVEKYDPTKSSNLKGHVYSQLQALNRLAPQITDPMPIPERMRRDRAEIYSAVEQLRNDMGREPTDEEVQEITGIPLKRVLKVKSVQHANIPLSVFEGTDTDEDATPEIAVSRRTPMDDWVDAVYHDSDSIDKIVLQHKSGYRGAQILGNQQIAKLLNISPAAVSQRAARLQARLEEFNG